MSKRDPSGSTPPSTQAPATPSLFSQIAAKVGVTPAAVTLAMQDSPSISAATKQRVFWASRKLGYRKSRARQNQLLNIAVIVGVLDRSGTLQNSRDVEMWEGISSCAEANEMSLHTYIMPPPGKRLEFRNLPVLLRRDQLDGVIILGLAFPSLLTFLRKAHIPTVVASNVELSTPFDQVRIDMVEGGRAITKKMIEMGHKQIGFLTNGCNLLVHRQVLRGYESVMKEHNLYDGKLVRLVPGSELPGLSPADSLLAEKPTAIIAPTITAMYHVAFAAIHERMPFDGSFVIGTAGHNGAPDLLFPTVHLNTHARIAGITAFERLMETRLDPKQDPRVQLVNCEIETTLPKA